MKDAAQPPLPADAAGRDVLAQAAANFGFGTALSIGAVALPLTALAAGYDATAVGLLTAASAVSQLGVRLALPALLRRFPDRTLVAFACALLAVSYASLLASTALPVFVLAQSLQGLSRGLFWTGTQTHAVRSGGGTVRRLAQMQILSNFGTLSGPALAGALATIHLPLALIAGVLGAAISGLVTLALNRLPPFQRRESARRGELWREPDVLVGSLATFTAGGWRSLLNSYVPVILAAAGHGPAVIGILIALSDAASMVASAVLVPFQTGRPRMIMRAGVLLMGVVIAALPFAAFHPLVIGGLLLVGGTGSGLVVVLGPALVSDAVHPEARGEALAVAGTLRAVALLLSPAGVALALTAMPITIAMMGAGALIGGVPLGLSVYLRRSRRGP